MERNQARFRQITDNMAANTKEFCHRLEEFNDFYSVIEIKAWLRCTAQVYRSTEDPELIPLIKLLQSYLCREKVLD